MRVGLIARATDRGLGIQTWEFARHVEPEAVAVVDLGHDPQFPQHFDRFPKATILKHRGRLLPTPVRRFVEQVDVIYTAETAYSPVLVREARKHGKPVVVHVNPEFWNDTEAGDRWWAPTCWRLKHLPNGTEVAPVPVATDRWPNPAEPHRGPCRWLHVAGKAAIYDRNGTEALARAIPHLTRPCEITVTTQDGQLPALPSNPVVQVRAADAAANYWDLYNGHDALVMPRRYGGLCLPVNEAMGAGLAVLMTDCEPNPQTWPAATVAAHPGPAEHMRAGRIEVAAVDPVELARAMDAFADPDMRAAHQAEARAWADEHSWERWAPRYRDLLAA